MALLQIAEPGESTVPHQHRLAAGIDLGTTNSLVATVRSGTAETLADADGRHLLPSVVRYTAAGVAVGDAAVAAAIDDPTNTIASVKRLMGRGLHDVERLAGTLPYAFEHDQAQVPRIRTAAGAVTAVEVSAEILRVLGARATETLGGELDGVVITVPAYFDDAQRQATKDAARLAGLRVLRLLNEPTAAAVAYGLDRDEDGIHAIYDLGGGTFDISILHLNKGVFEVMATGGDSALGGDDLDRAVAEWLLAELGIDQTADVGFLRQLTTRAREAKERLTEEPSAAVALILPDGANASLELSRERFETLIEPLIRRTLRACRRTLRDAGVDADAIADVVMVGGSTRVPLVRRLVGELFGRKPLVDIDPERVVAVGAAIQADILVGNKPDGQTLLLDVNPLSLGIETMGGLVEKIIPRNTTIPAARAQEFTTFRDGQTALAIHVLQGERELVDDCRSLARFELRGIPPMVAGQARIRVTFTVDADGLLSVTAREEGSGVEAAIEVKPSYGLNDREIETMLRESIDHATEDLEARRLREQQVEGRRVVEALTAALASDGDELLSAAERATVEQALAGLRAVVDGTQADAIKAAVDALETHCGFYVQRRMDRSIRAAMSGHRVDEF